MGRKEGKMSSKYKHGLSTKRKKTAAVRPDLCASLVQCVIGTAPVNTLENPYGAVNVPLLIEEKEQAEDVVGFTNEIERYTIMHSIHACFDKHAVAPITVINVLDPANPRHVEADVGVTVPIVKNMAVVKECGILLDKVSVSDDSTTYEVEKDYLTSFDSDGYLVIAVTDDGALNGKGNINVTYTKINPDGVTEEDIIGGVDKNRVKTGLELLDDVYPETGVFPSVVIAPVYSRIPAVAVALEAKVQRIFGMFNGIAFVDLDATETGAKNFYQVKDAKEKSVPSSRWVAAFWPMVKSEGHVLSFSAFAAALLQSITAANKNIPSESVDNMELLIDGICTADGSMVIMTQDDVNDYLNANGVIGALKIPEWKAWGNNTAAYPDSKDPIDRWVKGVTMLNYLENKFKSDYLPSIGRDCSYKLVQSIVGEYNMTLNSLTPDYIAGGEIIFDREENPIEKIRIGHLKFRTRYADYAPTEYIENEFAYDVGILEASFEGGKDE